MFKYTIKKLIYYPKELYYKSIRKRNVYFTEFVHNGKHYRILADHCNVSVMLTRIQKDDLKILAFFKKMSVSKVIQEAVAFYLDNQNLVEFIDEFQVLKKDDRYKFKSSAEILENNENNENREKNENRNDEECY